MTDQIRDPASEIRHLKVLVVCKDLFFTARIGETAKLTGAAVEFVRSPGELEPKLSGASFDLAIVDLTTQAWDYDAILATLKTVVPPLPILAFTTHVLAKTTQPYHSRCDRVVTKETFTQELPEILKNGITRNLTC